MNAEQAVNFCLNRVQTDYVCFCADDDIILTEGLHTGIEFLNGHHEYAGFTGEAKLIGTINDQPFCPDITITDYDLYHSEDCRENRIKEFILNPKALIFSAIRTSLAIKAWGEVITLNKYHQTYIFGEMIHGICVLNGGKLKKFDFNFCCRHGHANNTYAKINFYKWFTLTEFYESYQKVFFQLCLSIDNKAGVLPLDISTNLMQRFCLGVFKNFIKQQEKITNPIVQSKMKRVLKQNRLIVFILTFKRFLYRKKLEKNISSNPRNKDSLSTYLKIVTNHVPNIPLS